METPLGNANPRQVSGLHLRPVLLEGGKYLPVLFYVRNVVDLDKSGGGNNLEQHLFDLLDQRSQIKYPYQAKASHPDNRCAISTKPV